ncbi:MAG: methyltransferase domain-containing protein [Candidatus Omnitrophota bacterium]|jgi:SAM-dependent methyltransferase/esterase/lipase
MGIISEIITYANRENKKIVGFYDYMNYRPENGLVIIPPAYGETKKDSLKVSYFLVKNGFNVIRYDSTCHVGESEGDMIDADFEKMKNDILSTLDFAEKKFNAGTLGIVGSSLAIRTAIKAASQDKRIRFLLGLVSIVDIRSALKAIYHQDVIGEILNNEYRGKTIDDIMGFEVSINFALSAIKNKYHDLETTREDIRKVDIPIVLIAAEKDPWVNLIDVREALDLSPSTNKEFVAIPNAMHQLNENPEMAFFALQQTVIFAKKYLVHIDLKPEEVAVPSPDEMSGQWKIEEKRLKNLLQKNLEGEKAFWEKYLNKFILINKSRDYRDFLKLIYESMDIQQGESVLDAGCGNGHFGAWMLESLIEKIFREKIEFENFSVVNYLGLDFAENSLKEASLKHLNMLRRIYRELCIRERYKIVDYKYLLADLESPLSFADNTFDKICCNLVISYVKDPGFTVGELFRVMKPGGKIVVSSMKPYADLSQIYSNFADQAEEPEEIDEARKLLSAAGRIKQKENAGIYNFFPEEELFRFLNNAGAKNIKILRAFANQANLSVSEK